MLILYALFWLISLSGVLLPVPGWVTPLALLILFVGSLALWRVRTGSFRELGFASRGAFLASLGLGAAVSIIATVVLWLILLAAGALGFEPVSMQSGEFVRILLIATLRIVAIVIVEEMVFRGVFYQLADRRAGSANALALSAVLFGAAHIPTMLADRLSAGPIALGTVSFSLLGVALALGFERRRRSLWLPIGLHAAYNLSQTLLIVVGSLVLSGPHSLAFNGSEALLGAESWHPESGWLGLILGAALILLTLALVPRRQTDSA